MKIRVKITRDGSNAVRGIDLEEYLKGVVPSEIKASSCPMEAQKAQAIAARTWAMLRVEQRKNKPYDVDDTANCQAYNARPRHKNSDTAVDATRGEVVTHNGKLIDAVYTHSNGGRMVSAVRRWGTAVPYLIDKPDPFDKSACVSGHGVGLSQTGAAEMARQDATYWSILAYYYPGTRVTKIKEEAEPVDDLNSKLSEHFTLGEFYDPQNYADVIDPARAPRVKATDIDKRIINLLEGLREKYREKWPGAVIIIRPHGGYRPDPLNAKVGGASGSQHRTGNAADFYVQLPDKTRVDAPTLAVWTETFMDELGYRGGVGMYKATHDYIHVDARGKNVAWYDSYKSAGCPGQGGRPCVYKSGTKGAGVVLIQRALGLKNPDGKYGANTERAVKVFQRKHGLDDDGVFGRATNKAMGSILPWEV